MIDDVQAAHEVLDRMSIASGPIQVRVEQLLKTCRELGRRLIEESAQHHKNLRYIAAKLDTSPTWPEISEAVRRLQSSNKQSAERINHIAQRAAALEERVREASRPQLQDRPAPRTIQVVAVCENAQCQDKFHFYILGTRHHYVTIRVP